MAYKNSNNRVNPEAKQDTTIKPVATPVNTMISYTPQLEEAYKTAGTAKALASIGQGLMDMDSMWKMQAQENAIKAQFMTEAQGGNKQDWAEVSRNIKGLAKFNPYNDNAYRELQAQDIYRAAMLKVASHPELEKLDPQQYYKLVEDANAEMLEGFRQTGISPSEYSSSLVQWDKQRTNLEKNYIVKHAEYTDKQLLIKEASDFKFKAESAIAEKGVDKVLALKNITDEKIKELTSLGKADDTILGVLTAGAKSLLATSGSKITSAEFSAAFSDLTINGKKACELVPDYEASMQKLYTEAKRAIYADKELDYANHQLDLKINSQKAMKDMYDWTKQNPNASYEAVLQQAQAVITKYNLEEEGFNFIGRMASSKATLIEMQSVQSNPDVLQSLGAKAALGTLTGDEVNQAVLDNQLNWKDALSFTDRINREAKADMAAVKSSFNTFHSKLGKSGYYGQQLGVNSQEIKDINGAINQIVLDVNNGKKTPEKAIQEIQAWERIANAKVKIKNMKADNDNFLLDKKWINSQAPISYNNKTAIAAFNKLKIERGKLGQAIKVDITSAPHKVRTINGKINRHTEAYDLGASKDTRIHNIPRAGRVIFAGYSNSLGNYVVIKYSDEQGKTLGYLRMGHLATSTAYLRGKTIAAGAYIGMAGSTGYSSGIHLHTDFWNKERKSISVEQFTKGLRL